MKNTTKILLFFSAFFNLLAVIAIGFLAYNHFFAMLPGFDRMWIIAAGMFGMIGFLLVYVAIAIK